MLTGGLQKLTLIDYPGKVACTVFCVGCNFKCPWCYNPELVLPEKIKNQPRVSEKDFFKFLKSRQGLIEGVVISGGEPIIHKDLPEFCQKIKKMGFLVKLDTNGSNPAMLKKLIDKKLVDYVAMDIKAPLGVKAQSSKRKAQKYDILTGAKGNLNKVKESIKIIKSSGIDCEFRTTIVPTLFVKEDIIQIAKEIGGNPSMASGQASSTGSGQGRYYLQNFRPEKTIDPKFKKIKLYSKEYLLEIQRAVSPFFEICRIRP